MLKGIFVNYDSSTLNNTPIQFLASLIFLLSTLKRENHANYFLSDSRRSNLSKRIWVKPQEQQIQSFSGSTGHFGQQVYSIEVAGVAGLGCTSLSGRKGRFGWNRRTLFPNLLTWRTKPKKINGRNLMQHVFANFQWDFRWKERPLLKGRACLKNDENGSRNLML